MIEVGLKIIIWLKQNGRVVYIDPKDKNVFWSQDTQHGTFEKHDIKVNIWVKFDIEGNMTKPAGNHKLNIKINLRFDDDFIWLEEYESRIIMVWRYI